jgi:hypothetical protein
VHPGPGGELELSSSTLIELGQLPLSRSSSQRIEMDPRMWEAMPEPIRSVQVFVETGLAGALDRAPGTL